MLPLTGAIAIAPKCNVAQKKSEDLHVVDVVIHGTCQFRRENVDLHLPIRQYVRRYPLLREKSGSVFSLGRRYWPKDSTMAPRHVWLARAKLLFGAGRNSFGQSRL